MPGEGADPAVVYDAWKSGLAHPHPGKSADHQSDQDDTQVQTGRKYVFGLKDSNKDKTGREI